MTAQALLPPEEHVLSTLERDGSRRWLKPRLSTGRFWNLRRIVAYSVVAAFLTLPHLRVFGKPPILIDLPARTLTLLGWTFLPTDTILLALLLVGWLLTIVITTALIGRAFCGWVCPHTVFMEFVFRPIERLFEGSGDKPVSPFRRAARLFTYLVAAAVVAHTFLAYFIGTDALWQWMQQSPFQHPAPFAVMVFATAAMMFHFTYFREQLCLIACPYGRFQSVMLDRNTLIVAYDKRRGEPRGKKSKRQAADPLAVLGDCTDCNACVRTCPTGIDIRNGLQMECVNCTQCIDACNDVMKKMGREPNLIRYASQNGIDGVPSRRLRPRLALYAIALTGVFTAFGFVLANQKSFDAKVFRNPGLPFTKLADGRIGNNMRLRLMNRVEGDTEFHVAVLDRTDVTVDLGDKAVAGPAGQVVTQSILVEAPPEAFRSGPFDLKLEVANTAGEKRILTCRLLGPYGQR